MRVWLWLLVAGLPVVAGCSAQGSLAPFGHSAQHAVSPLASRQVVREAQWVLARHYRIAVGFASPEPAAVAGLPANLRARDALTQHLRRYFSRVSVDPLPQSLDAALATAAAANAQLLLFPRVVSWPASAAAAACEPASVPGSAPVAADSHAENLAENPAENPTETPAKTPAQAGGGAIPAGCVAAPAGELALLVSVYDVGSGQQLDAIYAHARLGIESRWRDTSAEELDALSGLLVSRITAMAHAHRQ